MKILDTNGGEEIIFSCMVRKKAAIGHSDRIFLLTNRKYYNIDKGTFKCDIPRSVKVDRI